MQSRATALVRDGALGYDQKLRRLATLTTEAMTLLAFRHHSRPRGSYQCNTLAHEDLPSR